MSHVTLAHALDHAVLNLDGELTWDLAPSSPTPSTRWSSSSSRPRAAEPRPRITS